MSAAGSARETGQTPRIDDLRQMCDAPSDAYSAGAWCEAANVLLAELETQRQRADQAEAELGRALDAFNASCAETDRFEAALAAARQERDSFERALNAATRLWPQSDVVEAELAAVRQRETQLREALVRIKKMGVSFDAKGTRSEQVYEIACAVLADTSPPPTLSEPEKSRPEPDAQPLTAGVAQAAVESGCSGSLSARDTSLPEPEPCEFCGDGPCIANCESAGGAGVVSDR